MTEHCFILQLALSLEIGFPKTKFDRIETRNKNIKLRHSHIIDIHSFFRSFVHSCMHTRMSFIRQSTYCTIVYTFRSRGQTIWKNGRVSPPCSFQNTDLPPLLAIQQMSVQSNVYHTHMYNTLYVH